MKILERLLVFSLFLYLSSSLAQENVFLKRDYWKANPSIDKIEQDIAAGNDITALTASLFDPVCYALMERTDNATIKHLLSKKGNPVDKLTHDGRTYIFWAAYRNNLEIMHYLVDLGAKANIEDSHGYSVLNFAAVTGQTNPKLYDFLLAHKADIKATNHDGANALLLLAPFIKDYALVHYFTEKGLPLTSQDKLGNGLFHYAAKGGHIELMNKLIAKGVAFDQRNKDGGNAILAASQGTRNTQNTLETYRYLEKLGLQPAIVDSNGKTPLHHIAAKSEDLAIYDFFMEKGVDVNQQDSEGISPFMTAAHKNSLKVVAHLADAVEDLNAKDKNGRSALALAVSRNTPEIVRFLLEKGAEGATVDNKGNSLGYYLAMAYNPKDPEAFEAKLSLLQANGLVLTTLQQNGNTLLHLAAQENNLELLKRWNTFGIDINQKNDDGNTALHLAAMSSHSNDMLKYLVEQGADTSLKTDFEESVYDLVSENEKLKHQLSSLDFLK